VRPSRLLSRAYRSFWPRLVLSATNCQILRHTPTFSLTTLLVRAPPRDYTQRLPLFPMATSSCSSATFLAFCGDRRPLPLEKRTTNNLSWNEFTPSLRELLLFDDSPPSLSSFGRRSSSFSSVFPLCFLLLRFSRSLDRGCITLEV